MLTTQAEPDSVNGSITGLVETLTGLPEKKLTQEVTSFPDDAVGTTDTRLYGLELREQELLTEFMDRHPAVVAIRRQLQVDSSIPADQDSSGSQEPHLLTAIYMV